MSRRAKGVVFVGSMIALAAATAALSGSPAGALSPASREPGGTLALRRFLAGIGAAVRDADYPPDGPATFVLLADERDEREAARLLAWASGGGRLVVADPASAIAESLSASFNPVVVAPAIVRSERITLVAPGCATTETDGVRRIAVPRAEASAWESLAAGVPCFPGDDGSFSITVRHGAGEVLLLGGPSLFTNRLIGRADNALYVARALAPAPRGSGGPVVFGSAAPPGARRPAGAWASLPSGAKTIVVQLIVAAALFTLARARRVGLPREEVVPSPIPAGELVLAKAKVLRAAGASGHAVRLIREHTAGRIARRLGIETAGPSEPASMDAIAEVTGPLAAALSEDARSDDDLIRVATRLEELRATVEGAT